jgi:hypothetical protein
VDRDLLGVIRDHRWVRAGTQRKRLEAAGCRSIIELEGKKSVATQADMIRMARPERTLVLAHAFLLADPKARGRRGGVKQNFDEVLAAIHKRGGIVLDLETGLTTDLDFHRRAVVALSHDHIGRSQKGLRSALNGARSRGRPALWRDPKDRKVVWEEWHSNEHQTNLDAIAAIEARTGKKIHQSTAWRVVREMRREKGKADATGASGREPGSPILRALAKQRVAAEPKPCRIYFIRSGDRVKIGYSRSYKNRTTSIQVSSPHETELLGTIHGDEDAERKLHARFDEYRERGEWFRIEGRLEKYLQRFRKTKK